FCRVPEVDMVVGKAGRAETPTDPAPLDMIETMINFRPPEFWPRRCLCSADAERQTRAVLDALVMREIIAAPADPDALANAAAMEALPLFDAQMREAAYQRNREFERALGDRLTFFVRDRLLTLLAANRALRAGASAAGPPTTSHAAHLAMDPSRE